MRWKVKAYSNSQIKLAGDVVRHGDNSSPEYANAIEVLDNWRAAHAYPLQCIYMAFHRYAPKNAIVAQRLKRLHSIVGKLRRHPSMGLLRMQDLGGCRVIVNNVDLVYSIANRYKNSHTPNILKKEYDYIQNPKESGYRSLHLVYEYHSKQKPEYDKGMLIEVQLRTKLQHTWATAVETIGEFTRQALKADEGDDYLRRFFALVSSAFALDEGLPCVPNTPTDREELNKEMRQLANQYKIVDLLKAAAISVHEVSDAKSRGNSSCLLQINYEKKVVQFRFFSKAEIDKAIAAYNKLENTGEPNRINAVLVSVSSIAQLRKAFPNYFIDIGDFIEYVQQIVEI